MKTAPTAGQLSLALVPAGLGFVAAMLYPEASQDLRLFRTIYAVRLSLLLAIPALALFPFRDRSDGAHNAWRLFWSFSFAAYLVHFGYAWFGVFGGQVETARLYPELFKVAAGPGVADLVVEHQGRPILLSNLAVTALWGLDVALAWFAGGATGGRRRLVVGIHAFSWLYVIISFVIASIVFAKNPTIRYMGWGLVGVASASPILRAFSPRPAAP